MDPLPLLGFFALVLALAFFAGTEIPLMSVSSHKLETFIRQKRFWARTLAKLKKNNERLLITNLIGTLIVTSAPTLVADKYIAPQITQFFQISSELSTTIVYIFSFITILLLWELTSKIVGVRFSDKIALASAPIYQILIWIFLPVTWLVEIFVKILSWITGGKLDFHGVQVSEDELNAFIDMSHSSGAVEADERRQIKNLLSLPDTTAESVMTPRVNVEFLSLDMTVDDACTFFMRSSHSRIPIYGETPDDIDFVITFREAFKLQSEWLGSKLLSLLDLEKIMKVPVTQPLDDLFEKFQKSRRHIALVLDEHGGTAGVVTMEDVLEEVFGDIKDEKDKEDIYMLSKSDGKIEAVWTALIDDILEEYDIRPEDIELPEEYIWEPISYIIMAEKEAFPKENSRIQFASSTHSLSLRVLSIDGTVIEKVECTKKEIWA